MTTSDRHRRETPTCFRLLGNLLIYHRLYGYGPARTRPRRR